MITAVSAQTPLKTSGRVVPSRSSSAPIAAPAINSNTEATRRPIPDWRRQQGRSRRQAAATLFRVMLSYSGQTSRSQKFREPLELIFIESIAGRTDLRTVERSVEAVLQLTGDL